MNKTIVMLALCLAVGAHAAPQPLPLPSPAATPVPTTTPAIPSTPAALDPAQLRELRSRYAQWQALPESERARIRDAARRVAALPAAQQQTLRVRFGEQDQRFREGWLLGPQLGQQFPKLQGLFGYLPADQREPALAALRQLNEGQLAQLTLIAQRTPPQERDRVRDQFIGLAPAARDSWLKENLVR
ncbi:DUF3106 domain-containing protein [Stenotrophomonas sp. ISL-67]|uniref:DUF3106 domain-containing protein n=1 Tax=Stenotrophomonas sp. ISL-67 TaxID=2819171 RepID=UPI001BE58F6D|nr:DUF3106 domain-containing protein [Stenotrophomonas sp. ISL-67]MBT2767772.1 DUF3106 domain-containing protein [Stenotrophomonas sp. ISL-67]